MRRMVLMGFPVVLAAAVWSAACGGEQAQPGAEQAAPPEAAPAEQAAPAAPAAAEVALPEGVTPEMVAQGKEIFASTGLCYTCHGVDAKGTPLAPDLTDATWLNIDGSYASIVELVKTGVPAPKEHQAPMAPMGGAQLSEDQVRAVAAYVYTLAPRM